MSTSIELRHLRYFLAVAETQNFTRAAERLSVSQPNISQQLKDLEQQLGTPLFQRVGKSVRLTEAGALLRPHAEQVLRKFTEACASVRDVGTASVGHLEVGVIPALHLAWIPGTLADVAAQFPGLTVSVHEQPSRAVETAVEAGRFDLGLGILTRTSPNLRYERLATEPMVVVVPTRHPLARCRRLGKDDLATQRVIALPDYFDMRRVADEVFTRLGLRPQVAFEVNTIAATLAAVASTGCIAVLPAVVMRGNERHDLAAIPIEGAPVKLELGIFWRAGAEPSPAAVRFAELLRVRVAAASPRRKVRARS
jgi:LysR family cyn operon transcriptional activator